MGQENKDVSLNEESQQEKDRFKDEGKEGMAESKGPQKASSASFIHTFLQKFFHMQMGRKALKLKKM